MKKIEIMGCGYIGLPTAITFTLAGYEVCGFDVKDTVVDTLNAGHIHIVEPGLQDAMTKAMATGRLHFTTKPEPADVFIICVQTPYRETEEHKRVSDMRFVESAAKEVGSVLRAGNLCVLESTSASLFHAHGGEDRLGNVRPCAGAVHDGALPGAHHPRPDAHRAARE